MVEILLFWFSNPVLNIPWRYFLNSIYLTFQIRTNGENITFTMEATAMHETCESVHIYLVFTEAFGSTYVDWNIVKTV